MKIEELPPVTVDVQEPAGLVVVIIDTDWGKRGGTLSPARALELAGELEGAAQYARTLEK